jgi:hypothetical protein
MAVTPAGRLHAGDCAPQLTLVRPLSLVGAHMGPPIHFAPDGVSPGGRSRQANRCRDRGRKKQPRSVKPHPATASFCLTPEAGHRLTNLWAPAMLVDGGILDPDIMQEEDIQALRTAVATLEHPGLPVALARSPVRQSSYSIANCQKRHRRR